MANVHASWVRVLNGATTEVPGPPGTAHVVPVFDLTTADRLTDFTSSGTSGLIQSGGSDFEAPSRGFLLIHSDGDVNIAAADAPTASATAGIFLQAGLTLTLPVMKGDKIAVVDA